MAGRRSQYSTVQNTLNCVRLYWLLARCVCVCRSSATTYSSGGRVGGSTAPSPLSAYVRRAVGRTSFFSQKEADSTTRFGEGQNRGGGATLVSPLAAVAAVGRKGTRRSWGRAVPVSATSYASHNESYICSANAIHTAATTARLSLHCRHPGPHCQRPVIKGFKDNNNDARTMFMVLSS